MKTIFKQKTVSYSINKYGITFLLTCSIVFLTGCGIDYFSIGKNYAKKYDSCIESYLKDIEKINNDFSKEDISSYSTRSEAINEYKDRIVECYITYEDEWNKIDIETELTLSKLKTKEDVYEFNIGLQSRQNNEFERAPEIKAEDLPANVKSRISSIHPTKPDNNKICNDLIGRSVGEGVDDGYYPQSWTYKIGEETISDFKILKVMEDYNNSYTIQASMRLNSDTRSYEAKLKIRYTLDNIHDWQIDYVQSQGLKIVKTGNYDNCIKARKVDFGYELHNNCDIALEVGGKGLYSGIWRKFRVIISPHEETHLYISDYIIDYIERP